MCLVFCVCINHLSLYHASYANPSTAGARILWENLTHWGRVMHICVGNLTIIGSDNGLSPCRRQAIIWTNAGILLIGPLGTNFSEILIGIQTFSFKKLHLKTSSAKWRLFCLSLNELSQNHGCWCPGSLCCQAISSHGVECIELDWVHKSFDWIILGMGSANERCSYSVRLPLIGCVQLSIPRNLLGSFWVWAQPMRDAVTM